MPKMIVFESESDFIDNCSNKDITKECFVIHDYCHSWELFEIGNFACLNERYGRENIFIEEGINKLNKKEVTVSDYISKVLSGERKMGNWSWQPHLTNADSLQNSYKIPEAVTLNSIEKSLVGELVLAPWILMSSPETLTTMHKDMLSVNGVVGQLQGVKEFTLVAPQYDLEEGRFYSSHELELLGIPFESVVLQSGDFLYFPMNWWHQAKTVECSVTFIHSTVNSYNLTAFLDDSISQMPSYIQRIQLAAKKRNYFGSRVKWLCNGFRLFGRDNA